MSSCKNFFLSQGTLFTWDTFSDNTQRVNTARHPWDTARRKREGTGFPVPSQKVLVYPVLLAEVTLQQALESLAVASLVR